MIPEERLSTEAVRGQLFNPWLRQDEKSSHWGPIALSDPTFGLDVRLWTLETNGADVFISAPEVPATILFTRSGDVTEVSLAFDQNGRPAIAFVEDGSAWLYWYNSLVESQVFTEMSVDWVSGVTNPRVTLDDHRPEFIAESDVILGYVRGGNLYYRQQRDRYETERLLQTGVSSLAHISMNSKLRLQFIIGGVGDVDWSLAEIVEELCVRAGINATNVSVSELYDTLVPGYKIAGGDGINKRIDALRQMFYFDKSEADKKVSFPRRGREVVARIPYSDLVADDPSALKITRIQESELPKSYTVNHLDPAGGFAKNKQTSQRRSNLVKATKQTVVNSEVVLTADQAMTAATVGLKLPYHEQQFYAFATWIKYAKVVNADVVEVEDKKGTWHRIRITERNDEHPIIKFEGVQDAGKEVYQSLGIGLSLPPPISTTPGVIGETRLEILNIPVLLDQDDELGVYIAVTGETSAWYGSQILVSSDGGVNFYEAMQIETPATLGESLTDLEDEVSAEYPADQSFEVLVNFPLESIDYATLLSNGNRCVLGDEILQFQFAVLLGTVGTKYHYRLSGLVRGRYATEVEFWPTDTRFVLIDSSIAFMQAQQWMLGKELLIKPVSLGLTEDETTPTGYDYLEGVSQREFPVHNVEAIRDVSNNVTVTFIGRGRLGIGTAPRNGKYFTGYRVKFSNGHTIDLLYGVGFDAPTTATYNSAPSGLTVQVCALNSITGEGPYSTAIST